MKFVFPFLLAVAFGGSSISVYAGISDICLNNTRQVVRDYLLHVEMSTLCQLGKDYSLMDRPGSTSPFNKVVIFPVDCGIRKTKAVIFYDESDPSCPTGKPWLADEGG